MQVSVDFERDIGHPDAEKGAAYLAQLRQQLAEGKGGPVVEKQGKSLTQKPGEDTSE